MTYKILKRLLDLMGSAILLIFFSPIFVIISICIKLTSKGPILFYQIRLGENAKPFRCYKFRTMYIDNDRIYDQEFVKNLIDGKYGKIGENPTFKLKHDPRVTPLGRLLRITSIDELPQLINILKGEMSLVGPRSSIPYEYEKYQEWHKERLSVKPGITGLWQVTGRSSTTFDEMVQMDIEYTKTKSFVLDLKILLRTVCIGLSGKGAY